MAKLYEAFIDEGNFLTAFKKVAAKGSRGGVDGISVAEFGRTLKRNLAALRRQIDAGTYAPQAVEAVVVPKFNQDNEYRELGLPTVADKVVQAALLQVVTPLAEKRFLDCSYAYRPGKGHTKAIRRIDHYLLHQRCRWVAVQDIDNCFDSLDHERLLDAFSSLVGGDQRLVDLVALWCRTGIVARDGHWKDVEAGVRQGQIISPLLANLYLHPLDEFARTHGWGWVRYADNYLILSEHEEQVRSADQEVSAFLNGTLHLRLNRNDRPVQSIDDGFVFLGIHFQGVKRSIAIEKMEKVRKRLKWMLSPKGPADFPALLKALAFKVEGWRRYYGFLEPKEQFAEIEGILDGGLTALIANRVANGIWPRNALEGTYPSLNGENATEEERRQRLLALWGKGVAMATANSKHRVEKLVNTRRKQHQREQVKGSELIVTAPGHFIGRRGDRIVVRKQQTVISEIPGLRLQGLTVACHGVALSSDVIHFCSDRNISVCFMRPCGQIVAMLDKPDGVRAELAFIQAKERDGNKGMHLAKLFVTGKMKNQFALLKSYAKYDRLRNERFARAFGEAVTPMASLMDETAAVEPKNDAFAFRQQLMGLEGAFGAKYWKVMRALLPEEMDFPGRKHQGAKDLVNSLLNYGYGILYNQTLNALAKTGLNAQAGFLHSYQPGKPVLVFDLVEEFRATVVDRPVFTMLNRREPLNQQEDGLLCEESRKKTATSVLARLGCEVTHRGRRTTIQEVLGHQAMSVRRYLLGQERYRPFRIKW